MQWKHRCSLDWLNARQRFLNASEIKELIPYTKTGRQRKIDDNDYARILAKKFVMLTEDDCVSTGAAARGHIMEPYAIEDYNQMYSDNLHHWDDVLIYDELGAAYSPDGFDIEQPNGLIQISADAISPSTLIEVKSYNEKNHFDCAFTPNSELEERWQIATAMYVSLSIDNAILVNYNPAIKTAKLIRHTFSRDDLADEMMIIDAVVRKWKNFLTSSRAIEMASVQNDLHTEKDIYDDYLAKERLNP